MNLKKKATIGLKKLKLLLKPNMETLTKEPVTSQTFAQKFNAVNPKSPWELQFRQEANKALTQTELPTTRNENWRYTRLTKLFNFPFESINQTHNNSTFSNNLQAQIIDGDYIENNIINTNIKALNVITEIENNTEFVTKHLGSLTKTNPNYFTWLAQSKFTTGFFIHLSKGNQTTQPLHVKVIANANNNGQNLKHLILVEDNASVEINFELECNAQQFAFVNQTIEIICGQNSKVTFNQITYKAQNLHAINQIYVLQNKNAHFQSNQFQFGGSLIRNFIQVTQQGEHTETHLYGLNFGKNNHHIDTQTFINHALPNGFSSELYRTVLNHKATGVFNGKVLVAQHAQKTNAFQANNNILLTDEATMNAKPELEIYANDVKCSHGSTTGQLDENAMFYLQARGIPKKTALQLLVKAFSHEVAEKVQNHAVKSQVDEFIDRFFDQYEKQ